MRTKKLFSLLLAVLMLCSLSVSAFAAETAQASVPVVLTVVNSCLAHLRQRPRLPAGHGFGRLCCNGIQRRH